MDIFIKYIIYAMIFSPLFAAAFITLIPTVDLNSKITLSRFFAFVSFFSFLCVLALFVDNQLLAQYSISFKVSDFYVNFAINTTKYNIFLYGAMAATLLANMILYELNDTKTNTHQVAPFILTFIIFITLGQKDLRIALPIISMSNFIIYFLIGYGGKIHRSSTIFQMGIFLFTCDALVLILLQYQEIVGQSSIFAQALKLAIVVAGLARIGVPLTAPYMVKLFLNVDEAEGPFLITYLQITGFAILVLVRSELAVVPPYLSSFLAVITVLSALYLAFAAVFEKRATILPYYVSTFYATIIANVIFLSDLQSYWHQSAALLLSNIACFLHLSKSSLVLSQYQHFYSMQPRIKATWFFSLCLFIGIPGLGIGASLWPIIYFVLAKNIEVFAHPWQNWWFYWVLFYGLALFIMNYALIANFKKDIFKHYRENNSFIDYRLPIHKLFYLSPVIIEVITLAIPLATLYVSSRTLS